MPRYAVPILKFVGTISLGLLTGLSLTSTRILTPHLLALPSATTASKSLTNLRASLSRQASALLALSITSYTLAFVLSPKKGARHPYLLLTSAMAGVSWAVGWGLERREAIKAVQSPSAGSKGEEDDYVDAAGSRVGVMTPTSASDNEDNAGFGLHDGPAKGVNGEQVRSSIERFGFVEGWRGSIAGAAFLMGVLGLYGDGVGLRDV